MKEFYFKVSFCDGYYANGLYIIVANNEEEATQVALTEIGQKLYTAFPDLDIDYSIELVED